MDRKTPRIVVGVDGTAAGRAALEFAMREAVVRGRAVEVVTVWSWSGPHESLAGAGTAEEARLRAQRKQDEVVAEVLRTSAGTPVVSRQVVRGDPAEVLLRLARDADYLVVGTEHKGVLRRTVLGSVSERCVRHATCPVVVVPSAQQQGRQAALTADMAS